ncbi:kinase-like domain-containing protein, partial [Blastocladiella britannica]
RASILKEITVHSRLNHPNIIKLLNHFETPLYYILVLELAPGGELFHRIVHLTYLSEPLARHVIVQVASAIRYLHTTCGVVHRDIKPENLLFVPIPFGELGQIATGRTPGEAKEDEGPFIPGVGGGGIGVIKLADFGLSKIVWTDGTKTPCGTVGYTAPEIVTAQSYNTSVDLWALGCVLYTMLCGFPPFYDEDTAILTRKVAHGQWTFLEPWWNNVSQPAKDLVSRLLNVQPAQRMTIDQFFEHPWIVGEPETTESPAAVPEPAAPTIPPFAAAAQAMETPANGSFDWSSLALPTLHTPTAEATSPPGEPTKSAGVGTGVHAKWGAVHSGTPTIRTPGLAVHYRDYASAAQRAANELVEGLTAKQAARHDVATVQQQQQLQQQQQGHASQLRTWGGLASALPRVVTPLVASVRSHGCRRQSPIAIQNSGMPAPFPSPVAFTPASPKTPVVNGSTENGSDQSAAGESGFKLNLGSPSILGRRQAAAAKAAAVADTKGPEEEDVREE